jgi:hypothetical protein
VIIAHTQKGYLNAKHNLMNGAHSGNLSSEEFQEAITILKEEI